MRGSAKHLLDWCSSIHFRDELNGLIAEGSASLNETDRWQPFGKANPDHRREMEIPGFCARHGGGIGNLDRLTGWWLPPQDDGRDRKGATWDLLSTCTILGKKGLLLVEAKAHAGELSSSGKPEDPEASDQSQRNHRHIRNTLRDTSLQLNEGTGGGYNISVDHHYQLANRIAWAWKLAECGTPVILLYLGFTGDTYFPKDYLRDADHWKRAMDKYLRGVVPAGLPGKPIPSTSGASFTLLVKSLPVMEPSSKDDKPVKQSPPDPLKRPVQI